MVIDRQCLAGLPCAADNYLQGKGSYWSGGLDTWYINLSVGGYGREYSNLAWWQGLAHVLAALWVMITAAWFRAYLRGRVAVLSVDDVRPGHFAVWVKNLKPDFDCAELEEFLENKGTGETQKAQIYTINIAYDLDIYLATILRLIDLHEQLLSLQAAKGSILHLETAEVARTQAEITEEEAKLKAEQRLFRIGCKDRQVGQAFVTFKRQTEARKVSKRWGKTNLQLFCRYLAHNVCRSRSQDFVDSYFIARLAPEPSDILWENLSVGWRYRQFRRGVTWAASLALIGGNFYGMIRLKGLQRSWFQGLNSGQLVDMYYEFTAFSFLLSVLIVLSNKVLSVLIRVLTAKEAHHSWTHFHQSVAHKLILLMALNSTGVLLAMNPFQDAQWFAPTGLVRDLLSLMLTEAIVGSLTYLFSPMHLAKLLRRWLLERADRAGTFSLTQIRANEVWENVPVDLAQRYANVLKVLFLTVTFCALEPLILPLAIFTLLCGYACAKVSTS